MSTKLQSLSRQVNWFVGCRLQQIYNTPGFGRDLIPSPETIYLLRQYNDVVHKLRLSIKTDYRKKKEEIIVFRGQNLGLDP